MPKDYLRLAFLKMGRDFMSPRNSMMRQLIRSQTLSPENTPPLVRAVWAVVEAGGVAVEEAAILLDVEAGFFTEGNPDRLLPSPALVLAKGWPALLQEMNAEAWAEQAPFFKEYLKSAAEQIQFSLAALEVSAPVRVEEEAPPPLLQFEEESEPEPEPKPAPLPRLILSDPNVAPAPRSPLAVQLGQAFAAVLNFHDTDRSWAAKNIFAFFKVSDFQDFLAGIMVPTIAQMQDKILPVLEARYAAGLRECGQVLVDYAAGRLIFEARKSRGIRIGQPNLGAAARKSSRSMPSGAADHLEPEPDSRARFLRASQASCFFRDGEPMPPPNRKLKDFNRQELDAVVQELMEVLKGYKGPETALAVELKLPYSTFRRIRSGGAGFMPSPEEMRKKRWPSTLARIDGEALAASPHLKDYMKLGEKAAVITAPKCG